MTKARQEQVSLDDTPYYHCIMRCVRRAFLCGEDKVTGRSYEHRKAWIVDRIAVLSEVFAIDVCAYAVMSNHFHIVVRVNTDSAQHWSDKAVAERWCSLFKGNLLVNRWLSSKAKPLHEAELKVVKEIVAEWRDRLTNISWFMRCLNEHIARLANKEDNCKGRFWEGRFKSQALLDEAAILTCMAYVDLNPIRAKLAKTPENSDYTSIQNRLEQRPEVNAIQKSKQPLKTAAKNKKGCKQPSTSESDTEFKIPTLLPFTGNEKPDCCSTARGIPFNEVDYFALVDWTGRAIRDDKRGHIPNHLLPILERLNINPDEWLPTVKHFGRRFSRCAGAVDHIRHWCKQQGNAWGRGISASRAFYTTNVV